MIDMSMRIFLELHLCFVENFQKNFSEAITIYR